MIKYKKSSYVTIFSPDESLMINVGGSVSLFDMNQDAPKFLFANNALTNTYHAVFSPDMKKIAISNTSGRLALIDSTTGKLLQKNRGVGSEGDKIHFIDDIHVLISGWNGKVGRWNTVTNKLDILFAMDGNYLFWPVLECGKFLIFKVAQKVIGSYVKCFGIQIASIDLKHKGKTEILFDNIGEEEQRYFIPTISNKNRTRFYCYQGESSWKKELYYDCFDLDSRAIIQETYSLKKPFPIDLLVTDRDRIIWFVDDMGLATFLDPATKGAVQMNLGMISRASFNFYGLDKVVVGDYDYLSFFTVDEMTSFRGIKKSTKAKIPPKAESEKKENAAAIGTSAFTRLHVFLYGVIRDMIGTWNEKDIFAVGIYLYPDECQEDEEMTAMEEFSIQCGYESDFKGNAEVEKWNPSEWGGARDIKLGKMGPVKFKKLLKVLTEVALRLQQEGFLKQKYQKPIPFIFCEFEPTGRTIEATAKANPNGEAEKFLLMV